MKQITSLVLGRVIKIRVNGQITKKLANKIAEGLHKSRFYKPEGVVVTINSFGGSISQAKTISDIIKKFASQKNIPVYCFAEDYCISSANLILTSGVKCYTNSMTLLGNYGYSLNSLWFDKLKQKYQIKCDNLKANQNALNMDLLQQMSPESEKWMKQYLQSLQQDLKNTIYTNRSQSRNQLKITQAQFNEKLKNAGCISTQEAAKIGIIDGIMDCDELLDNKFKGVKVYEVNNKKTDEYSGSQFNLKQIRQLANPYKNLF